MEIALKADQREVLGKKVKKLRKNGQIPAVLYGRKSDPISLALNRKEFFQVQKVAGEATLIDLQIPGQKETKALIRQIQRHPVSDNILHVDLYRVDMTQEIETEIPFEFTGVSPAVEELEGNLITNKDSVKVKCLPNKLVSEIKVDIGTLKTFEDLIHLSDINVPAGIEVLDDSEEIVAQVTPPRSEEELAELEAETTAAAETEKAQIETMETQAAAEKAEKESAEETEENQEAAPPTKEKESSK
ncbi:MAG: 50S ribosomal protein L25 [Patescibacteria group bacterium]|jgi:large subunit ribosomal protein L25